MYLGTADLNRAVTVVAHSQAVNYIQTEDSSCEMEGLGKEAETADFVIVVARRAVANAADWSSDMAMVVDNSLG